MSANVRLVVSQVLNQLGTSRAARHYLKQYSEGEETHFAVIKVGGAILRDQLEALAEALAFLRNLGLLPIILHGAGPQLDEALKKASVDTNKVDGLRITTPEVMRVARPVIYRVNRELVSALEDQGARAQGVLHGVFTCDYLDKAALGLVGTVQKVELDTINDLLQRNILPVVAPLGETASGQMMNINADVAARELTWKVKPHKIIFISDKGGLLNKSGRVLSAISLRTEYEKLMAEPWLHSGMRLKLQQIAELFTRLPESASVSITSVQNLARELFTHRGAGTLIRVGEEIVETREAIDIESQQKIAALLEGSFKRKLRKDYFDSAPVECIFSSESFGAVAIVLKGADGIPYLDKFAVTPEAQGVGLGAAVWQTLRRNYPQMYWRSRANNPITPWYFEQAHTSYTEDQWVSFSVGITDFGQIERCKADSFTRVESWATESEGKPSRDRAG